jgi:NAD(P)-dependent dehydrogenase (short-subunit alcohol dehydrogenase family)
MELRHKTVMILGGSGLVGQAVARRVLAQGPVRLVLVALTEAELREAQHALEPHRGDSKIEIEWGNVFLPGAVARLDRAALLADAQHRALLLEDLFGDLTDEVLGRSLLFQILARYRPAAVVDSINTATAFAYQDVSQSARQLLAAATTGTIDRAAVERHVLTLTMPQLIRHVQIMMEALRRLGTEAYVKIGTSGTGGMGLNIPYTHSEERPSRTLLTKSAVGGAHSLLLFLMARTPGAPATIEIKPTATIAWREIAHGPVQRRGRPIPLVDCTTPVGIEAAFQPEARPWEDLGRPLVGVYINVGENGLFSRAEFETVTTLGSMEFITPEEVADYVMLELGGRPTGRDVIAALDAATAGPTYRAGILREPALARLRALERETGGRVVAYEMLGPPRLSKMLFEADLCARLRGSVRALAQSAAPGLAAEAHALLQREHDLRRHILSVGLPILAPDGLCVYRGPDVVVPPDRGARDPLAAAARGWVDLRPAQFATWIGRAAEMVRIAGTRLALSEDSGSDVDWTAIGADDPIEPARFAAWVFSHEEFGERIKR